jgi:Co/Zn/Cd efflux system component
VIELADALRMVIVSLSVLIASTLAFATVEAFKLRQKPPIRRPPFKYTMLFVVGYFCLVISVAQFAYARLGVVPITPALYFAVFGLAINFLALMLLVSHNHRYRNQFTDDRRKS